MAKTALPLPLLPICGETREDIASQLGMGLEILSAVSGVEVEVLASKVDVLLTDTTEHNKEVNVILQELYQLDKPAGQIFLWYSHHTWFFQHYEQCSDEGGAKNGLG